MPAKFAVMHLWYMCIITKAKRFFKPFCAFLSQKKYGI